VARTNECNVAVVVMMFVTLTIEATLSPVSSVIGNLSGLPSRCFYGPLGIKIDEVPRVRRWQD